MEQRFPLIYRELTTALTGFGYKAGILYGTNDIWARDYMPIQVDKKSFVEFSYAPDYLQGAQKGYRNLKTYPDIVCSNLSLNTTKTNLILDGGNVVKSKDCIIMTDKILNENKQLGTRKQILEQLTSTFQTDKIVLIPWDKHCPYGHADGMLRFINDDTVLISGFYDNADNELKAKLLQALTKAHLNIEWLRCRDKESEDNIAYINFLQTKDFILLPKLNKDTDDTALKAISQYYPEYPQQSIIPINVTNLFEQGGALNCISWTINSETIYKIPCPIQQELFKCTSDQPYPIPQTNGSFLTKHPFNDPDYKKSPWICTFLFDKATGNLFCSMIHRMTNDRRYGWDYQGTALPIDFL